MRDTDGSSNSLMDQVEAHNRMMLDQINSTLTNGMASALKSAQHYVVCNETTGVLSVIASTTLSKDKTIAYGPDGFSQCLAYVNSTVVARWAERGDPVDSDKQNGEKWYG